MNEIRPSNSIWKFLVSLSMHLMLCSTKLSRVFVLSAINTQIVSHGFIDVWWMFSTTQINSEGGPFILWHLAFRKRHTVLAGRLVSQNLLLVVTFLITTLLLALSSLGLLPPNTTRSATTKGTREGEIDMLLGIEADDEGRDVDDLLADADVALLNQDTGVMDGLGKAELVDAGLQAALQKIFDLQGQHVIELHARFVQHTDSYETSNQGIAFEETLGILLVESEKLTVGLGGLSQSYCCLGKMKSSLE
jgi:hypothetical protein